jgi:hypothetical protein
MSVIYRIPDAGYTNDTAPGVVLEQVAATVGIAPAPGLPVASHKDVHGAFPKVTPFLKIVVITAPFWAAWYPLTVVIATSDHPCKSFRYPLSTADEPTAPLGNKVIHKQALSGTIGAPHEIKSSMSISAVEDVAV